MPDIQGTPVVRTWNVVHLGARTLAPAAEAFRYFLIENGDAFLRERTGQLLATAAAPLAGAQPVRRTAVRWPEP